MRAQESRLGLGQPDAQGGAVAVAVEHLHGAARRHPAVDRVDLGHAARQAHLVAQPLDRPHQQLLGRDRHEALLVRNLVAGVELELAGAAR